MFTIVYPPITTSCSNMARIITSAPQHKPSSTVCALLLSDHRALASYCPWISLYDLLTCILPIPVSSSSSDRHGKQNSDQRVPFIPCTLMQPLWYNITIYAGVHRIHQPSLYPFHPHTNPHPHPNLRHPKASLSTDKNPKKFRHPTSIISWSPN